MRDQVISQEFVHFLDSLPDLFQWRLGETVCNLENALNVRDQLLMLVT
jgi:hypothetical protein